MFCTFVFFVFTVYLSLICVNKNCIKNINDGQYNNTQSISWMINDNHGHYQHDHYQHNQYQQLNQNNQQQNHYNHNNHNYYNSK